MHILLKPILQTYFSDAFIFLIIIHVALSILPGELTGIGNNHWLCIKMIDNQRKAPLIPVITAGQRQLFKNLPAKLQPA